MRENMTWEDLGTAVEELAAQIRETVSGRMQCSRSPAAACRVPVRSPTRSG